MTVRAKLLALGILAGVFSMAVTGVGYLGLSKSTSYADEIAEQHSAVSEQAADVKVLMLQLRRYEKDLFLNLGNQKKMEGYTKKFKKKVKTMHVQLDALEKLTKDEKDQADVKVLRANLEKYLPAMTALQKMALAGKIPTPQAGNKMIKPYKDYIRSLEGTANNLAKRSNHRLHEAQKAQHRTASTTTWLIAVLGILAAVLSFVVSQSVSRSITKPLNKTVNILKSVAEGDLDVTIDLQRDDELGQMGKALNVAIKNTKSAYETIEERNTSMRMVLDNVDQGFITIDGKGCMAQEHSAIVEDWFGEPHERELFSEYISKSVPDFGEWFQIAWDEVEEGIMPLEVLMGQLPARLTHNEHEFELLYQPIMVNGELQACLVVISDITATLEAQKLKNQQLEIVSLFQKLLKDRPGVMSFIDESEKLMGSIKTSKDITLLKRQLHTLKGNMAIFEVNSVAEVCHVLEDNVINETRAPNQEEIKELEAQVKRVSQEIHSISDSVSSDKFEVSNVELHKVVERLLDGVDAKEVASELLRWPLEPAERPLQRIADNASRLAQRLGKGDLRIEQKGNEVRMGHERWQPFWSSLVHVVRNAVDHGLETPEERELAGKNPRGKLILETQYSGDDILINISDDGRGINWDALRSKAKKIGLAHDNTVDLTDALFSDGVSTKEAATEVSGRGVGTAAVKQACEELGGQINVSTEPGNGTTFSFRFPGAAKKEVAS